MHVALVLLTLASGAADAFAFLVLGGIFTANMTGNLVLAGMFTRPGWPTTLAGALTAIVVFAALVFGAFRVSPAPSAGTPYPVRSVGALAAAALGVQTVLAKRLSGASGLTTTFVTGTLTSLMEGLAEARRGSRVLQLAVVLALVVGAVAGTALARAVPPAAPLLPLLLVATATAVLLVARHHAGRTHRAGTD